MKIHRLNLFRPAPLAHVLTLEAKAVCPLPCAVQTFNLVGSDGFSTQAHIVWENRSRGLAAMAFLPPGAPTWAEETVKRIAEEAKR